MKIQIMVDYANVKNYTLVTFEGSKTDLGFHTFEAAIAFIERQLDK